VIQNGYSDKLKIRRAFVFANLGKEFMKVNKTSTFLRVVAFLLLTGCVRNSNQTWEDFKTAGRYMQRGVDVLWGKEYESRMLVSNDEFTGPCDDEFIPLKDVDLRGLSAQADLARPQPKGIPGERGIPSLDRFYAPPKSLGLHLVHFDTDEHILKDKNDLVVIQQLTDYLKANLNTYLLVEGHTDERASASYNMALGMRRANYIRALLIKNGVDLNRVYTVTFGKERPLVQANTKDGWRENRRAEFKIFEK